MTRFAPLSLALLVAACGGEPSTSSDVGNPAKAARFALGLDEGPAAGSAEGELSVTSAQAYVREAKLQLQEGFACADQELVEGGGVTCDDDDPRVLVIAGPVLADLVAGTTEPSWADVQIPAAPYARVDVRLTDGEPLGDKSFVAESPFEAQGEEVTLRLRLSFQESVRFPAPDGIVEVGAQETLLAELDPDVWLDGADIDGCLEDGRLMVVDGVVEMDDAARGREGCPHLERDIRANIRQSGGLRGKR